jgi:hypothetical protein
MKMKSEAFLVFSEFGPDRAIPRFERLTSRFPQLSADDVAIWLKEFEAVEAKAYDLAVEHRKKNLKPVVTIEQIRAAFPFLDAEAAGSAFNQAMYFSWRDGA